MVEPRSTKRPFVNDQGGDPQYIKFQLVHIFKKFSFHFGDLRHSAFRQKAGHNFWKDVIG
jgi:hypothetical protein